MADKPYSEFRKDLVSGDWILVAPSRRKKPEFFKDEIREQSASEEEIKNCPFEEPQKSGNSEPVLWYPRPESSEEDKKNPDNWFIQVLSNRYPLLFHEDACPTLINNNDIEYKLPGIGYHEVVITRDHNKRISRMTDDEVELVFRVYQERYLSLTKDSCIKYVLVFHNCGKAAGASVTHPHSQIIALPIIDPDISRSLNGSWNFYKIYKKCVHCALLEKELTEKTRVIQQSQYFISLSPFASRVPYEIRVYPIKHFSRFEEITPRMRRDLAALVRDTLKRLEKTLGNPDYNFFIHSAPTADGSDFEHYHWHIEILPRGFKWAGLELGIGIEVVVVPPEEAAEKLRAVVLAG